MCLCPQVQLSTLPPEPVIPSKKPFKVELIGGKRYSWCTCGHSKKQVKPSLFPCFITPVWSTRPVYSLITSLSYSLSATEPTRPKPKAWPRYALSQRKTPQFGCVVASTQITHRTVTARTSRTSLCLPHYMNQPTLEQEGCPRGEH